MKKLAVSFGIAILLLVAVVVVSGCASSGGQSDMGVLTGKVTVGPLTPVERAGVTPTVPNPEVFTSRKLLLYDADGKTRLEEIPVQAAGYQGTYNATLKPGTYRMGYDYMGSVRFIPPTFTIEAGKTTMLDVFIDTGIR